MKSKILATSAAMVALVGLSQIALAATEAHFTPVEDLVPEQRQAIYNYIANLVDQSGKIDWDKVVVGVNESGEITFKAKSETSLQAMSAPSTFGY